jgi:hypothetical protein
MLQALENGYATPEDWLKYSQSNHKGKQDFAMRIASNFHDDAQKKRDLANAQTQASIDASKAQAAYHIGQADAQKAAAPYAGTGIWTTDADGNPVQVGVYGQGMDPHMFPGQVIKSEKDTPTTGDPTVKVIRDPETKKVLGRTVTYPGTKQRDFLAEQPEETARVNQVTGQLEHWNGKTWVPEPQALQNQYRFFGPGGLANPKATPSPTPGLQDNAAVTDVINNLSTGQQAAPTPAATPAATPLDAIMSQIGGAGPAAAGPQMPQTGNPLDAILQSIAGGGGAAAAPAPSAGAGKKLDKATAMQFLQQAGGDPNAARQLAIAAGYSF